MAATAAHAGGAGIGLAAAMLVLGAALTAARPRCAPVELIDLRRASIAAPGRG